MKFGHFDDARKEYVITTPQTPLPWINYLGSEDFFSLVSNTAGGYSFYRDARMRRLTRYRYNSSPLDMDGHHQDPCPEAAHFHRNGCAGHAAEPCAGHPAGPCHGPL